MNITVTAIAENERSAFNNLIKMYCYEWSQYNLMDVDQNGIFPFEYHVHTYFERPRRYSYLVRVDGILAGFALIDEDFVIHKDYDYSMGEFFVMHKYRRYGVGKYLARTLFDRHKGKWEIGFHKNNKIAGLFWLNVIDEYTGGDYELVNDCQETNYNDGSHGSIVAFDTKKHSLSDTISKV